MSEEVVVGFKGVREPGIRDQVAESQRGRMAGYRKSGGGRKWSVWSAEESGGRKPEMRREFAGKKSVWSAEESGEGQLAEAKEREQIRMSCPISLGNDEEEEEREEEEEEE